MGKPGLNTAQSLLRKSISGFMVLILVAICKSLLESSTLQQSCKRITRKAFLEWKVYLPRTWTSAYPWYAYSRAVLSLVKWWLGTFVRWVHCPRVLRHHDRADGVASSTIPSTHKGKLHSTTFQVWKDDSCGPRLKCACKIVGKGSWETNTCRYYAGTVSLFNSRKITVSVHQKVQHTALEYPGMKCNKCYSKNKI